MIHTDSRVIEGLEAVFAAIAPERPDGGQGYHICHGGRNLFSGTRGDAL